MGVKAYVDAYEQWLESDTAEPTIDQPVKKVEVNEKTLLIVKYSNGRVRLIFRYNKPLINLIKLQPFHQWDAKNAWWTIPHTETIMKSLVDFCNTFKWECKFVEDLRDLNRKPRMSPADIPNYRNVPDVYLGKLSVMRYSPNTVRTYCDCFKEFINYYNTKDLGEITQPEIIAYLRYLVEERCISSSYQNQAINSIKFYYEKLLQGPSISDIDPKSKNGKGISTKLKYSEVKVRPENARYWSVLGHFTFTSP